MPVRIHCLPLALSLWLYLLSSLPDRMEGQRRIIMVGAKNRIDGSDDEARNDEEVQRGRGRKTTH